MSQQVLFDSTQVTARRNSTKMFGEYLGKRLGDGVHEHSNNPHKKLWLTVIVIAVMDCVNGRLPQLWFYTDECRYCCDLCGIEQDVLIKRVRHLLIGE